MRLVLRVISFAIGKLLFFLPGPTQGTVAFEIVSRLGRLLQRPPPGGPDAPRYLNLGCGDQILAGFLNLDFFTTPKIDYGADLRYPLALESNAFDGVFSEHTVEHLTYAESAALLRECHRILKPGGLLRIVVPDLALFIRHYSAGDQQWFAAWERLMFSGSTDPARARRLLSTPLEAISFVTQEYGHLSAWDFETLAVYAGRCGFSEITRQAFRQGALPALLVDLDAEDRKFVSLYLEARKGA